ncbi:hypothetical protein [Chitinophaga deserti]|uniref:hypothetical protein n=1 Tax=Chitinophaga deserti TaxID=2164099 RepID=UPI000D6B335B|nr:hypothetical protein [Chitinophaga deserti]
MKPKYLLPHYFKKIGWWIMIPALFVGLPFYTPLDEGSFPLAGWIRDFFGESLQEFTMFLLLGALLLISYSREKDEDEYISRLRLESLQIAVITNYILLLIASLIWHWLDFLAVMMYNMFTILIIFIIRFHYLLYRQKKAAA